MDTHTCKLCSRRFSNGRALGGHMRSHLAPPVFLSSSSSSGFDQEDPNPERLETAGCVSYGLRENPRKSSRLVDPQFNISGQFSAGVVLDGESETESCRRAAASAAATSRRRSKRQWRRQSPVSCISDVTTSSDVDVAFCLIMLSQDSWDDDAPHIVKRERGTDECRQSELSDYSPRALSGFGSRKEGGKGKGKYVCVTCKKVFKSYQSLGGHRANHKKLKPPQPQPPAAVASGDYEEEEGRHLDCDDGNGADLKASSIHECLVCFRVFKSAQALGGHKKAHFLSASATQIPANLSCSAAAAAASSSADAVKFERSFIDLNLPAPMEEDDAEIGSVVVEDSAVSCVGG